MPPLEGVKKISQNLVKFWPILAPKSPITRRRKRSSSRRRSRKGSERRSKGSRSGRRRSVRKQNAHPR